jgi:hypothetical protein
MHLKENTKRNDTLTITDARMFLVNRCTFVNELKEPYRGDEYGKNRLEPGMAERHQRHALPSANLTRHMILNISFHRNPT